MNPVRVHIEGRKAMFSDMNAGWVDIGEDMNGEWVHIVEHGCHVTE
jgi:hypothetical protein